MTLLPETLARLISLLNRLPGIGARSAERIALHLVNSDPASVKQLADALITARERIRFCSVCGALTELDPCLICIDARRDGSVICVVEKPVDIISIEKTGVFKGKYHVLGGKISPLSGVEPEDLRIAQLEKRIAPENIKEVILALGADVEGDATSYYIANRLAALGVKVSRIAHGIPAGGGLEFADQITLSRAIEGRRQIQSDDSKGD
ncbi:MAG: recombination mediator RecR [Verrucomicrobiia bacterium]